MERPRNIEGSEVDSQGVPWEESFTHRELNNLEFVLHVDQNVVTDAHFPQTPLTDIIPQIHVIDTTNKGSVGEFFNRHRRGPYKKGA